MILLLKHWREALIVAAILGLVGMCRARDNALVEKGRAEVEATHFRQRNDRLIAFSDSVMRAFRQDTIRLTRWRTKWDTVKAAPDTVPVEVIVAVADSTIQACSITVQTCSKALAAKDSLLEQTHQLYTAREKAIRSQHRHEVVKWSILSLLLGAGLATFQMH